MPPYLPRADLATHSVTNQPVPHEDVSLWDSDVVLRAAATREGASAHLARLAAFGATMGAAETLEEARTANRCAPELRAFDPGGRRIDEVVYHPAYHAIMTRAAQAGYAALPWRDATPGGHVAHAALVYLLGQVEPGCCCPLTMTYAAAPVLRREPDIAARWLPGILTGDYDPASLPAPQKRGLTVGMAMTEKQGGSDVRANATEARPDGAGWRLNGHKWFCSAPMSDAFLTLARTQGGLTCFLAPRWTPDGTRNRIEIQRLKDKLGDRANASAEIEYRDAFAERIGPEGAGVRTIVEMVHHTRLDTATAPAALMRRALAEAAWWCGRRSAFGRNLIDQPLMRRVLADLALEWEAATALAFRVARAFDDSARSAGAAAFARIGVAIAKFWSNKRCPSMVAEAMECVGGAGFVAESPMPMLYRQAPLNGIWEGAGNVICLDILRTLDKAPEAAPSLRAELEAARGADRHFDRALSALDLRPPDETEARRLAATLALLLQAALLLRHAPHAVADAFCATRLGGQGGAVAGVLPAGADIGAILARI
jgi:putative acyl-CoA dehydrogenase